MAEPAARCPPELLGQFIAHRLKSALQASSQAASALRAAGDFQLVLGVRDEHGDVDYAVVDVRAGVVAAKGIGDVDTRARYASLQLSAAHVAKLLSGGTVEPELAYETAPLLSVIAQALNASSGVSPWQTRL